MYDSNESKDEAELACLRQVKQKITPLLPESGSLTSIFFFLCDSSL